MKSPVSITTYPNLIIINYDDNTQKYEYTNGDFCWCKIIKYKNGGLDSIRHNLDGPAYKIGNRLQWWINGNRLNCKTQKEFERYIKLLIFI